VELSRRLGIPVDDDREKARFPRLYRKQFWRIRMAPWRDRHDEIALALRSLPELKAAMPLLAESLRVLPKSFDAHAEDHRP
jgi:hypothetical protein